MLGYRGLTAVCSAHTQQTSDIRHQKWPTVSSQTDFLTVAGEHVLQANSYMLEINSKLIDFTCSGRLFFQYAD